MSKLRIIQCIVICLCLNQAYCQDLTQREYSPPSLADSIPPTNWDEVSDKKLEGYLQALIDMNYYESQVVVTVKEGVVYLSNLPKNKLLAKSIISYVKEHPGVKKVIVTDVPIEDPGRLAHGNRIKRVRGIWFPQNTTLFAPLIANPRQVKYSLGYRMGDEVVGKQATAISFGDDFPIFRWRQVWKWKGDFQISIEAGCWTLFSYDTKGKKVQDQFAEHFNTDFLGGLTFTYAVEGWAYRLRIWHLSSHLGDELIINNPGIERVNPSMEAIDFFASYQLTAQIRLYGGMGVLHSDETFKLKPFYVEYGIECRFFGKKSHFHGLYYEPFIAMHFRNWQEYNFEIDGTYLVGYEFSKLQGIGRKFRVYFEYHHGFSLEGQFLIKRTSYASLSFSYGF